jgi:hypothetical protein
VISEKVKMPRSGKFLKKSKRRVPKNVWKSANAKFLKIYEKTQMWRSWIIKKRKMLLSMISYKAQMPRSHKNVLQSANVAILNNKKAQKSAALMKIYCNAPMPRTWKCTAKRKCRDHES